MARVKNRQSSDFPANRSHAFTVKGRFRFAQLAFESVDYGLGQRHTHSLAKLLR